MRKSSAALSPSRPLQRAAVTESPVVHGALRSPGQPLDAATHAFMEPGFGHEFSTIPAYTPTARVIQTKLAINQPGDEYEQEADRTADRVAMPTHHAISGAPLHIQRFSGQSSEQMRTAPASVDQALATPGRPLEPALRQDMEQRFGYDFSRVRVHSGAAAAQSARDMNANAYTVGHDIVFAGGRFAPETHHGQRLIAHELTHVVQQSAATGQIAVQRDTLKGAPLSDVPKLDAGWEKEILEVLNDKEDAETKAIEIKGVLLHAGVDVYLALYVRVAPEKPPAKDRLAVKFNRTFTGKTRQALLDRFMEVGQYYQPVRDAKAITKPKLSADVEKEILDLLDQKEDPDILASEIDPMVLGAPYEAYAALYARLSVDKPPAGDKLAAKFNRTFTGKLRQRVLDRFKEVGQYYEPPMVDPFPFLPPGVAPGRRTEPVHALGRIDAVPGVHLRSRPAAERGGPILPFDTLVSIDHKTIEEKGQQSWFYVVALGDDNERHNVTGVGFVEEYYVAQKPPEPTAHLYQVKRGDLLKDIAARFYKHNFAWGNDARVYVQAIYYANKDRSVVFQKKTDLTVDPRVFHTNNLIDALYFWKEAQVVEGQALWVPSNEFVKRLLAAGVINQASISKAVFEATVGAIMALIDWAKYMAGFVIGLLKGAWDALADLFTGVIDLIKAVWTVVKALFGDWDDLKEFAKKIKALWEHRGEIVDKIIADFTKKWEAKDDYDRGKFQGETLGYIMMTAFIILVTFGEGAVIEGAGRLGNFIKLIQVLNEAGDITSYAGKLAKATKLPAEVVDKARNVLKGKVSKVAKREISQAGREAEVVAGRVAETIEEEVISKGHLAQYAFEHEGHTWQILKDGRIVRCSKLCSIETLEKAFEDLLPRYPHLNDAVAQARRLEGQAAAEAATSLAQRLDQLRKAEKMPFEDLEKLIHRAEFAPGTRIGNDLRYLRYKKWQAGKLKFEEWEPTAYRIWENRKGGTLTEKELKEAFDLGPKNELTMINPDLKKPDFKPDHIVGNPSELEWGKPYHFEEIKDWADMSDTGNLKAMLEYVEQVPGSQLTIYYKSNTYMSGPLREKIEALWKKGIVDLIPFMGK